MGEKENHDAARQARHDVAVHPMAPSPHEDVLVRYLGGVAYRESHARHASKHAPQQEERPPGKES